MQVGITFYQIHWNIGRQRHREAPEPQEGPERSLRQDVGHASACAGLVFTGQRECPMGGPHAKRTERRDLTALPYERRVTDER